MSDALRLLTPREAAEILAVSVRAIYRMSRTGELASVGIGASLRFLRADLESFVEHHRRGSGVTPEPLRRGGRTMSLSVPRRRKEGASEN